jgi:hypothetical protein
MCCMLRVDDEMELAREMHRSHQLRAARVSHQIGQFEKSARPERKNFPFLSAAKPAQATPVIACDCELIRNFANNHN